MNYVFTPQTIKSRLYKTHFQILRDFWNEKSEVIAWTIIVGLLAGYMVSYMINFDKKFYAPVVAKWEVQNQRTGQVGTGSMILNPNYKVQ